MKRPEGKPVVAVLMGSKSDLPIVDGGLNGVGEFCGPH